LTHLELNASHLVNLRLCIKKSSVNPELRSWLLSFWISAHMQVLITKSLWADLQIAPRFHSFFQKQAHGLNFGNLSGQQYSSNPWSLEGVVWRLKNCQQGLFLELYERETARSLPLIASVLWFVWVGMRRAIPAHSSQPLALPPPETTELMGHFCPSVILEW